MLAGKKERLLRKEKNMRRKVIAGNWKMNMLPSNTIHRGVNATC